MKKIIKKPLALLLAFLLVFGSAPLSGFVGLGSKLPAFLKSGLFSLNASALYSEPYTYTLSGGYATIMKCDTTVSGALVIPGVLDDYPVTRIGNSAFFGCTALTSVTIPNSVTSIGYLAFRLCSALRYITIPDSVTFVDSSAFSGTAWFAAQPNGLVYAGKVAYEYKGTMPKNTRITLKAGTKGISPWVFDYCDNLRKVTIPNSVINIAEAAFLGCIGLQSIVVAADNPVYSSLNGVLFNKDKSELIRCPPKKLWSYTVPNSVTTIGPQAFEDCSTLAILIIPEGVTSIDSDVFYNCDRLTFWVVPNSTAHTYADDNGIPFFLIQEGFYVLQEPYKTHHLLGEALNLSGIQLLHIDAFNTLTDVELSACTVSAYNANSLGSQTISITYRGNTVTVDVLVVQAMAYPESAHPYPVETDKMWAYTHDLTSEYLEITFSKFTKVEDGYDYLEIYDAHWNLIEMSTGVELASQTITVLGNSFYIRLISDDYTTFYGFDITDITGFIVPLLTPVEGSGCVVDIDHLLIRGLVPGTTKQELESNLVQIKAGYSLTYSTTAEKLDNGTLVYVKNANNETVATFTVLLYISPVEDSGCVVDFDNWLISGLAPGTTKQQFEQNYVNVETGYSLAYSTENLGTGTQIDVKNASSETVATFTVVIMGDLNGDGAITASDALTVLKSVSGSITLNAVQQLAANVNNDSNVTASDALSILKFVSGSITEF